MDILIASLVNLFVFVAPFIILYFVIAAAVRKGIDNSILGRTALEKLLQRNDLKKE